MPHLAILSAYLLGSIPFGLLAGRLAGQDVRVQGSGNIGFANVLRVCGWRYGLPVLLLDVLKGFVPCFWIAPALSSDAWVLVLAGIGAILGHNFSLWLKLKGGKGVATSAGVLLALLPKPLGIALLVFLAVVAIWRYTSLGSLLSCLAMVAAHLALADEKPFGAETLPLTLMVLAMGALVFIQHRANIRRLLAGTENKILTPKPEVDASRSGVRSPGSTLGLSPRLLDPLEVEPLKPGARVTVIGDGGWGTAISLVLNERSARITIWGHDAAYLDAMRQSRENQLFLPGVNIPAEIQFEADLGRAFAGAELVLVAIPTQFLRLALKETKGLLPDNVPVASLTKGIEQGTLLRPSEIVSELLGCERIVVLSGPSHSEEVAKKLPTTVVAACEDEALARRVQGALMTPAFRVYTSVDCVGVELGGALKNVIAIAGGICTGLGLGDNAMAALMTRGLAEITRLGVALGAEPQTFAGLSGMGDLMVTCISPFGRNRAVGLELGRGRKLDDILGGMKQVAEGVTTVVSARELGRKAGVEMPIVEEVYRVLYEDKDPRRVVTDLMTREATAE